MSYITAIGTATPPHRFSQSTIADFMIRNMQLSSQDARRLNTVFKASGIEYRHSVLEDYGKQKDYSFYPETISHESFPSTEKRIKAFRENALPLSIAAAQQMIDSVPDFDPTKITHLIVVCCTGMYAPGLDIELVQRLKLSPSIHRTCITFMGCYAAFNAIKTADAFCKADPTSSVLIVCTELCSLHFQKESTEDNLLANALFADGAAALLVEATTSKAKRLKLESFYNDIAFEGSSDMAWTIGNFGFEMKLTAYVPNIIKEGIEKLTRGLLQKINKEVKDIKHFAIHPGGKKILETVEQQLSIPPEKNKHAYQVMKNFGNMSSPTVLFVLKEIFETLNTEDDDERIVSFAFGPGLTLESMVLKIEMN
jgi:predicted naringenin-chalcone synthase